MSFGSIEGFKFAFVRAPAVAWRRSFVPRSRRLYCRGVREWVLGLVGRFAMPAVFMRWRETSKKSISVKCVRPFLMEWMWD